MECRRKLNKLNKLTNEKLNFFTNFFKLFKASSFFLAIIFYEFNLNKLTRVIDNKLLLLLKILYTR
jgi:hypothetical protein